MFNDSSLIFRIERFLNELPPFTFFSKEDVLSISKKTLISVHSDYSFLFKKGEAAKEYFYIVKKGAVAINDPQGSTAVLIDKCGEGDLFGIRPLLADSDYLLDAVCLEKTILYEIPLIAFQEIYHKYPQAIDYMLQRFAAGRTMIDPTIMLEKKPITFANPTLIFNPDKDRKLISTTSEATIQAAICMMSENQVSSILVLGEDRYPLGIITDRDIRSFVARGYNGNMRVTELMSSPVKCIAPGITLSEAQLVMIESGYHHLCITESGTDNSPSIGIVTEHDILYAGATDPIVILKKIKRAQSINDLIEARTKINLIVPLFLQEEIDPKITLSQIDQLNRALIKQTIELTLQHFNNNRKIQLPVKSFAFLNMGSAARGEQLLMTDQDNAMIISDEWKERKPDYLKLAKEIVANLHAIGYKYCPADMMASNPEWCLTLQEFKDKIKPWVINPGPKEVMLTTIFFDFRYEYGDITLAQTFKEYVKKLLEENELYIRFLAAQAIKNPPPLSFFRSFIIENDGEHKDLFDIKLRGIAPLMDSARVLALDIPYLDSTNTIERFDAAKKIDPANEALFQEAQEAYLELLQIRIKVALESKNSGRYIDPKTLTKVDKMNLRKCFEPSRRLLDMLERNYKLGYF